MNPSRPLGEGPHSPLTELPKRERFLHSGPEASAPLPMFGGGLEAEPAAAPEADRSTVPRVLVVDDNSVNQKVAALLLERLGCQVEVAGDGAEAVELVRRLPFNVVFMDCMMPKMDGYEATAAIRAMPGPVARTPIVAMTANAMQGDRERCLAAGMDDYLSKPVRQDQLRDALARWAPDTAAAGPAPPIEVAVLEDIRELQEEGRPDLVGECIEHFLSTLPAHRAAIRRALGDSDLERLRAAADALKGGAAYIGAAELVRLCGELRMAALSGDLMTASSRCAALEAEADRAAGFLTLRRRVPAG